MGSVLRWLLGLACPQGLCPPMNARHRRPRGPQEQEARSSLEAGSGRGRPGTPTPCLCTILCGHSGAKVSRRPGKTERVLICFLKARAPGWLEMRGPARHPRFPDMLSALSSWHPASWLGSGPSLARCCRGSGGAVGHHSGFAGGAPWGLFPHRPSAVQVTAHPSVHPLPPLPHEDATTVLGPAGKCRRACM